jgi:hypothetical protein
MSALTQQGESMPTNKELEIKIQVDLEDIRHKMALAIGLEPVEGSVWCDMHGCVHDDTTNPYDMPAGSGDDICSDTDHRTLYMRKDEDI